MPQIDNPRVAHTPGPWFVVDPLADWEAGVTGGRPRTVVGYVEEEDEVGKFSQPIDVLDDLSAHDARLIAAAPDLLAAARETFMYAYVHGADCSVVPSAPESEELFDSMEGCDCYLSKLSAAIAKAEGREPQTEGPPCGCQQKRHNCDQFNGLPVTVRES